MSHSAVAVSIGGAAGPESATGGGSADLDVGASTTKQPPPEALQDGDTSNSLEPGEVVTPPHHRLSSSPALKKQMPLGKTLRKTLNNHNVIKDADGCEEKVRALYELTRKENGAQEAPMDEADDSEGLYSDTDSSVEDLKSVEDVQQARKEKQAEAAAAAALPQAPPTPFLGLSPLRFHMRAPPSCFDFPRMGFMPRMARGGPRGMRPPFFGRPPTPNRMGSSSSMLSGGQSTLPGAAQLPPGGGAGSQGSVGNNPGRYKRPQSDLSWTTLQPAVSFTFNLVAECSSTKHKDCKQKTESAKEPPASEEKVKNATEQSDPLRERSKDESQLNLPAKGKIKERDQNSGNTREKSQARDSTRESPERSREKSKARDLTRGKTREGSKEKECSKGKTREGSKEKECSRGRTRGASQQRKSRGNSRERNQSRGKTRERSRTRDQARGKTREKSRDRVKTATEKPRQVDQARDKDRKMSQERNPKRRTTRERSRERDHPRTKPTERSRSKEKHSEKCQDRKEKHRPKDKSTESLDKSEKSMDKSNEKRSRENHSEKSNENPRERSRRSSKERIHEKSAERVQQMEAKEQKEKLRDKKESNTEHAKDRLPQKSGERRRERSRDKLRERSRERYSKEKSQQQSSREKTTRHGNKHDKSRDHSGEKESRSRRAATPHDSFGDASQTHGKEGTPPMTPPQQRAQTPPASDTPKTKVFDIFADSPPRPNTAVLIEGSTTPPLKAAPVTAPPIAPTLAPRPTKLTPLLKASEIHSRIGALLEDDDNDLHLEALLATKEQLFRRTNEYKERKEAPKEIKAEKEVEPQRHVNPFNRESVLSSKRKSYSFQRNGSRHVASSDSEEDWDRDEERERESFKDISIKIEKDLTPPPPSQRKFTVTRIKVERNATPPPPRVSADRDSEVLVRNGAVAANAPPPPQAKEQESPDTDDYIDNWENDDSISSMPKNAAPATPTPAPTTAAAVPPLNITPLPPHPAQFNDDYDDGDEDDSNALWNANSTPPPRAKAAANLPMSNIHELYDKFMNSIDMGSAAEVQEEEDASKNSSLSNSTGEDSSSGSSGTSSTSSSSSDSDDDDDDSSSDEEEEDGNENTSGDDESPSAAAGAANSHTDDQQGKEHQQKKNNVSKDLRKLKSLEDNLARIQMMRENYDAGDEISEELLKMESIFLMQRNAIIAKYRKQELKSNSSEDQQQQPMEAPQVEPPPVEQGSPAPVNSIFDANRGAIKMTISRLKLTSKSAIFDKDETDQQTAPTKLPVEPPKLSLTLPLPPQKPPKEVAIVKPTIVESRSKPRVLRSPPPPASALGNRRRSRSRSISRNKSKRRSLRPTSRSQSPKRWRPPSPRRGSRFAKRNSGGSAATKMGRSHSRSLTRSRTRSRSPNRSRRRPPLAAGSRRRGSLSPGPTKVGGPRSPPHPLRLRRSLTRERDRDRRSRSPLPFKPPSPPMRRSWSHSRSPSRRRTRSRSRSPRFLRSPRDGGQSFADYFGEQQGMEAAAYYYNMSLMQQEYQDPTGTGYDTYAAYMDSAYNMEQAYAQFTEGYAQMYGDYPGEMDMSASPQLLGGSSVLRELPMAVPVAVQKGNVLEIVPTGEAMLTQDVSLMPAAAEEPLEDESKPKRKRVNFVDNVLPNYESESEDRAVVSMAVERALCQHQERRSRAAARLQQIRDELLALPPPPPPLTPKPPNLEKPVLVQKKPKFRYFHFDPIKGAIVKTHSRVLRLNLRPPFDPKHFAMLIRTGRLPPFPPNFMRHRPPNIPAHVDPATRASMLKDFFSKHPPPPLPMPMPMSMPMADGMPYYLSGPPPMPAGASSLSPVPQHIPVLGSHGGYQGYGHPSPVPVPVPVPPVAMPPLAAASVPAPTAASTPPPAMIAPFFTPPPLLPELLPKLPDLPTQFTVKSVPTITEIMPVDILQQLGPLPKTLDVDDGGGMASPELASNDLKEEDNADAEIEAAGEQQSAGVEEENKTQLLMETH